MGSELRVPRRESSGDPYCATPLGRRVPRRNIEPAQPCPRRYSRPLTTPRDRLHAMADWPLRCPECDRPMDWKGYALCLCEEDESESAAPFGVARSESSGGTGPTARTNPWSAAPSPTCSTDTHGGASGVGQVCSLPCPDPEEQASEIAWPSPGLGRRIRRHGNRHTWLRGVSCHVPHA